jgi:micrococcal nuclease
MELQSRETRLTGPRAALVAAALLTALGPGVAHAQARLPPASLPAAIEAQERGTVKAVLDGDTLTLADGRTVRLVGLLVPEPLPDARSAAAGRTAPLAAQATAVLSELALGRAVILGLAGRRTDRYGRLLAQVYRDDGLWLQGALLARGLARVLSHPDNRALVPAMLAQEAVARDGKRGLWAYRGFAVLTPAEARFHLDDFAIVEGRVAKVERRGSREALAFEPTRKDGFTALLLPESRKAFKAAGLAPGSLEGQRVRVRGYLRWWDGPILEVSHPEQIERIAP